MDRFKFRVFAPLINTYSYFDLTEVIKVNTDYVIQQCLGVKDKNNRLIYEGDIVLWKISDTQFCTGEIIWGTYSLAFMPRTLEINNLDFYDNCTNEKEFTWSELEVMGSIADNWLVDLDDNVIKEITEQDKCKLLELLK